MKQANEKQYAGVWLDNEKALLIAKSEEAGATDYAVQQKLKANENFGGGSEHSMNNTKQADSQKFFKLLAGSLLNFDEILVFGPGKAQEQFQNFLQQDAQFNNKKVSIDSAAHLTDPQMIATVRTFFKTRQ